MFLAVSYSGWAGAEMRAMSAVDIALWDLAGKAANLPIYKLLGGASRQSIRIYNTCYDRVDFILEPVRLARELLNSNIRAMKIWPFDPMAKETGGNHISVGQLKQATDPLRLIREEFGDSIDVAVEFHGFWNLPSAIKIAKALEPYKPMWLEEMLAQDNLASYADLARSTDLPLCVSERLMTRWGFRELFENRAAQIIMPDVSWCGGISEAKKIALWLRPIIFQLHLTTAAVRFCIMQQPILPPMCPTYSSWRASADTIWKNMMDWLRRCWFPRQENCPYLLAQA
jgi:L-alanine-DL-glutamate epimerase-like enolase superfamily enzyme